MNNDLYQRATSLYQAGDYQGALSAFTDCLQDTAAPLRPSERARLYHMIGNCLVKLKNLNEAIHAYTQATADENYDGASTVYTNLGMAYASLHDYENAIRCFDVAVADDACESPYKAYMGMGNALMRLGKTAEAGVAFREAALDEDNPDPTKALLNLGVCFMSLNRPADAVASYECALQFPMETQTKNRLYSSMGQAYVANGQMHEAVAAFEEALRDKTYFLSDSASVDYQRAIGAVSTGTAEISAVLPMADTSGLDVAADGSPMVSDAMYQQETVTNPYYYDEPYDEANYPGYIGAAQGNDDLFFTASDEEIQQVAKGLARQDRKRRNVGLKILVAFIIIVLLALAAAVFAYTQGYGYPTQQTVAEELFADPAAAKSTVFASDIDEATISTMLDPVVQDSNVTIEGIDQSMTSSTVYVQAKTPEGGVVNYKVSMVRDFIGWKVSQVELYFPSMSD